MPRLLELEKDGMDAVRRYSSQFDDWNPPSFELPPTEIQQGISRLSEQAIRDTDVCQENVRRFAQARVPIIERIKHNPARPIHRRPKRHRLHLRRHFQVGVKARIAGWELILDGQRGREPRESDDEEAGRQ